MNTPTRDELLKLDAAFDDEIKRVSTVEYNSNEICRAFYGRLRERFSDLLSAHQAQAEPKTMTPKELALRVKSGEQWKLADTAPPSSNQASLDEYKRRLADMCREYQALSVKADQTWNEAIEAAANVCRLMHCRPEFEPEFHDKQLAIAEKSIRGLARPSQAQEQRKPASGAAPSSDPIAWHSKQYGTCWMHLQPYHLEPGMRFFVRGRVEPVATIASKGGAILWHVATSEFEHGTFFYPCAIPEAQPVSGAVDDLPRIVAELREQAYEYRQEDRTAGMFADPEAANLFDEFADRIESISRAQQAPAVSDAQWMALPAGPIKSLYQARDALTGPAADGFSRRAAIAAIDAALSQPAAAPVSEQKLPALVAEARRQIAAQLPEDEPDYVPDWVCELLIKVGLTAAPVSEQPRKADGHFVHCGDSHKSPFGQTKEQSQ